MKTSIYKTILIISLISIVNTQLQINKTAVVPAAIQSRLISFFYDYLPSEDSVVFELNLVPNVSAPITETFVFDTAANGQYYLQNKTIFYDTAIVAVVKAMNVVQALQNKKTFVVGGGVSTTSLAVPEISVIYYSINSTVIRIQLKRKRLAQSTNTLNMTLCPYDTQIALQNQIQISFDLVNPFFIDCNFGQFLICTSQDISLGSAVYSRAQSIQLTTLFILMLALILTEI